MIAPLITSSTSMNCTARLFLSAIAKPQRVNLDATQLRPDVLQKGTVAKGAAESGAVEVRQALIRSPVCPRPFHKVFTQISQRSNCLPPSLLQAYMNYKVRRNPLANTRIAEFLGDFTAERTDAGFTKGTQWLIFGFESDSTLANALDGELGPFPESLSRFVLRKYVHFLYPSTSTLTASNRALGDQFPQQIHKLDTTCTTFHTGKWRILRSGII